MIDTLPRQTLRILYVWDSEYPWDVRTEKTCLALTEAGHDVHLVARNRNRASLVDNLREATVHRMRPWRLVGARLDGVLAFPAFFNPRWHSLIANTAWKIKADVIIVRDLPLCPTAIRVGRDLHIPVILDMAENYPAMMRAIWQTGRQRAIDFLVRNPRIVELTEQYCLRHVDHVFTVADEMSDRLVAMGVNRSRITCVSNTPALIDRPQVADVRGQTDDTIQLVYLGLMEVVRGINELIDAVALLRGRSPRVTLLLIGGGRDEHLFHARTVRHHLTDSEVIFAGHLPYHRALQLVAKADIGMLPLHRNEHMDTTLPNKLFDYMSVGLPVITSDTVPSARVIRDQNAGLVFEACDVERLVEAILSLTDAKLRHEMGANGRTAVARLYNWERDSAILVATVENVRLK